MGKTSRFFFCSNSTHDDARTLAETFVHSTYRISSALSTIEFWISINCSSEHVFLSLYPSRKTEIFRFAPPLIWMHMSHHIERCSIYVYIFQIYIFRQSPFLCHVHYVPCVSVLAFILGRWSVCCKTSKNQWMLNPFIRNPFFFLQIKYRIGSTHTHIIGVSSKYVLCIMFIQCEEWRTTTTTTAIRSQSKCIHEENNFKANKHSTHTHIVTWRNEQSFVLHSNARLKST